jgi:hypothetical protein
MSLLGVNDDSIHENGIEKGWKDKRERCFHFLVTNFVCIWIDLQWLIQHPQYLENILYVGGDSYSGIPIPIIVQEIFNGKEYSP